MLSQWDGSMCSCAGLNQSRTPRFSHSLWLPALLRRTLTSLPCSNGSGGGKDLAGKHQVHTGFFSFSSKNPRQACRKCRSGEIWIFSSAQLGVPRKHTDVLLRALFGHSVYNFTWDHRNWGFLLKSLFLFFHDLCSAMTQFHAKCGIYDSLGERRTGTQNWATFL